MKYHYVHFNILMCYITYMLCNTDKKVAHQTINELAQGGGQKRNHKKDSHLHSFL